MVLIVGGDQVPVMGGVLVDAKGNAGGTEFCRRGPIGLNVGLIWETTVTIKLEAEAHCPEAGVKT